MTDSVKMIRETLCVAQFAVTQLPDDYRAGRTKAQHVDQLQRLIELCDLLRPTGNDGKHGDLHTSWCGCDDDAEGRPVPDLRIRGFGDDGPPIVCS